MLFRLGSRARLSSRKKWRKSSPLQLRLMCGFFLLSTRRKSEQLPLFHFKIVSLNFKRFKAGWIKPKPFATTLSSLAPKCLHRTTSVLSICPRHVFVFSRRCARAAAQRRSAPNSSATIPCAPFVTQSLTLIGRTELILGPSSIGRARAVIQARLSNSLRLSKTTFRFGKPLAGASRMPLTPTCKTANPAVDLAPFSRWTLRDKAAQRRSPLR